MSKRAGTPLEIYVDDPIYRVYSAHDTQIANILAAIDPSYNFTYIKYASNIYFELYHQFNDDEYTVRTVYNG